MSKEPLAGVYTKAFAIRIERALKGIDFIGNDGKPYERDYEADARWYVAYHMAEDMRETYMVRDWAEFCLNGMQPLTDEDVKEWFFPEDEDEIGALPTEDQIRKFFHG